VREASVSVDREVSGCAQVYKYKFMLFQKTTEPTVLYSSTNTTYNEGPFTRSLARPAFFEQSRYGGADVCIGAAQNYSPQ
jgi:hypothetical protein